MKQRRSQRGFTLMELLITMVVTLFGLMGLMALHVTLTQGNDTVNRTQEAIAVGTQTVEQLRNMRPGKLAQELTGSSTAVPPMSVPNYATKLGRNNVSYSMDVSVVQVPAANNLWRVRVTVNWVDDANNQAHAVPLEIIRTAQEAM